MIVNVTDLLLLVLSPEALYPRACNILVKTSLTNGVMNPNKNSRSFGILAKMAPTTEYPQPTTNQIAFLGLNIYQYKV